MHRQVCRSHSICKALPMTDRGLLFLFIPNRNAINRCYDERCENRMTMTECTKADCNIDTCNNMRLSKRQYANVNVFKTASGKAWGLGSKSELKAGQLVIEYVGEVIDTQTVQQRLAQAKETGCDDFYMLGMDNQLYIDAQFKGNLARFMNHSCDPNCETQKWRVNGEIRIGIFAMKDIRKDEELTFNYQFDTFGNEASKVCRCESANCSGFLGMKPKKKNSGAMSTQESGQKHRVKKSLKKRKVRVEKITEDECYHCGDDGSLTLCDMNFCPKAYHVGCLGLEKAPHGQWHCPWHQCSQCSKKSTRFCVGCPTSTCDACSVQTELMGHVQRKLTAGAKSTRTFGLCSECTQEAGVSPDSATEHVATIIDKVLLNTQLHRSSGSRHRKTKSTQAQAHTLTTHTVEPIKRQTKRSVQAMEPLVLSDMEDDVSSEQSGSGLKQRDESSAPPRLSTTTPSEDTQKSSSGEEPAQTVAGPNMAQPRAEMSVDKDERSDRDSQVLASGSSIESNGDLAMSDDSGNASVSSHTESAVSAKSNSVMASEKAGVVSIVEDSLGESSACA
ncbi:hypothetical protein SARC_06292 [Sphaeroforma arctica JP610]|uniref:Histone-lysine N-methyltransferase NSD2 n=1 Tax=Sphaeroforma arctica JP610 TaxID=667725 RepID=A0A0L0FX28_9EUKA|nr:hypothetical protein SARC_06292 [Sphaeroforma arctica JP610]KNC81387.1 hypothetical protein SARC_06292 [Sphaeroforma arctica JP610]|eukprot:XP_014155289.1 hypothetical protein SARC_06292 [Sphaeroforma arctica JP610]